MQLDAMHDRLDKLEECLEFDLPFLYQELAKRVRKLEGRVEPIYDNELKEFVT